MTLNVTLQICMGRRKISIVDMATYLGITTTHLERILKGTKPFPVTKIPKICDKVRINIPSFLLHGITTEDFKSEKTKENWKVLKPVTLELYEKLLQ